MSDKKNHLKFITKTFVIFSVLIVSNAYAICITGGDFLNRDPYGRPAPSQMSFQYQQGMRFVNLTNTPKPNLKKAMFLNIPMVAGPVVPNDWCFDTSTMQIKFLTPQLRHNGIHFPYGNFIPNGSKILIHYYPLNKR